MTRKVLYLALVTSTACVISQEGFCTTGPTTYQKGILQGTPTPTATPTPTPTPSPSPVEAESCDFDVLRLQPVGGLTLAVKEESHLSLTPYLTLVCKAADKRVECVGKLEGARVLHEVAAACNLTVARLSSLVWSNSSPAAVSVGTGYEPTVIRLAPGIATITATLEGQVSNAVVVR